MAGPDEPDLKKWDRSRLTQVLHQTYADLWLQRTALAAQDIKQYPTFIKQENYPDGIRSTLRDFLTYRWVQVLADSRHWEPHQTNYVYLLDLKTLLAEQTIRDSEALAKLTDEQVHPLQKIAWLLSDLSVWHQSRRARQARLASQVDLVRQLNIYFTKAEQRLSLIHISEPTRPY